MATHRNGDINNMPITILADGATKKALERVIPILFRGLDANATFIHMEMLDDAHQLHIQFHGLNEALRVAPHGDPVIIFGIAPLHMVADDPRFQGAVGYPNVIFCDALRLAEGAPALLALQANPKPRNEVAIRLAHLKVTQSAVGTLKHDLDYARENEARKATWMALAVTEFGDLSFEELSGKVKAWTYEGSKPFNDEWLDGCFIDIEGTLIQDGVVNPAVAALIEVKSATTAVNLWTDGDIKALAPIIRKAGIYTNIVPKSLLSGATVAEAYDDLEESEFSNRFNIKVERYNQV
jgi:hypothetical protein